MVKGKFFYVVQAVGCFSLVAKAEELDDVMKRLKDAGNDLQTTRITPHFLEDD